MVSLSGLVEIANHCGAPLRGAPTGSRIFLVLRRNLMTGNYCSCLDCRAACPEGRAARA